MTRMLGNQKWDLTNCEPASHASQHVSNVRQTSVPSLFVILRLLASSHKFFAILTFLPLFCYRPSFLPSLVKISFVLFCSHSILRFDVLVMSVIHAYHLHALTDHGKC